MRSLPTTQPQPLPAAPGAKPRDGLAQPRGRPLQRERLARVQRRGHVADDAAAAEHAGQAQAAAPLGAPDADGRHVAGVAQHRRAERGDDGADAVAGGALGGDDVGGAARAAGGEGGAGGRAEGEGRRGGGGPGDGGAGDGGAGPGDLRAGSARDAGTGDDDVPAASLRARPARSPGSSSATPGAVRQQRPVERGTGKSPT
jgi:hypothetical protein